MGTPLFSKMVLEKLYELGYQNILVVTQPDKLVGRKKELKYSAVKHYALEKGLKLFQPLKIRKDFQTIIDFKPELIITAAYGQIIPQAILEIPKYGCVNFHASLLPKYRGGAPIQRAIMHNEKETGITLMYMNEKMDEGDILYQSSIPIDIVDTSSSLFEKLAHLSCEILETKLEDLFNGKLIPIRQDHSQATYAYNITKEEEFICFEDKTLNVYNHIRGLLSNPGCFGLIEGKKYKFHEVNFSIDTVSQAGIFLGLEDNYLKISCLDGYILVSKIQPEGKGIMDAKAFMNGYGARLRGKSFEKNT